MAKGFLRRFFSTIIKLINIGFIVALLFSVFSMYISPLEFWPLAFFGFVFPVFFIINVGFLFYYLLRKKKFVFLPLIAVIIGSFFILRYIQFGSNKEIQNPDRTLKILTHNVHVFSNWDKDNTTEAKFDNLDSVLSNIEDYDPDIVCFQEFYDGHRPIVKSVKKIRDLGYKHFHSVKYLDKEISYFVSTFSKYPIVNSGTVSSEKLQKKFSNYADIQLEDSSIVRIYNLHLMSIKLGDERRLMQELPEYAIEKENDKIKSNSLAVLRKMKKAFILRSFQIEVLRDHISNSEKPVIIAGDFNDTPVSYTYQQIKGDKKDAFMVAGKGFGSTYQGFPSFRIDYVFYDDFFEALKYKTIEGKESDHKAVFVELLF